MFDNYHHHSIEYIPFEKTITINENRAPTDESIKVWEEMKGKAYASVLENIQVQDNIVNWKAIVYKDFATYNKILKYNLSINGREINGELRMGLPLEKGVFEGVILKRLAEDIARKIMERILTGELGK